MRFDLTDLRLFLEVAEAESITGGAARANLALASASARIRGMEEAAGTALLQRGRRGVTPTPAGQAVLHHARLVLQQMQRMRGELGDYAQGLKGHVRILGNTAALTEFLPEPLAEWLAAHPRIDIDLEERPSHAIVEAVAAGLADFGIVADAADGGGVSQGGLETLPFRIDRLVLAVPRGHPLARRRRIAFAEVLDEDFVGLGPGSALQEHLGRHAARAGRALKLRVRLGGFDAVCRMVEQGVGLAVVPQTAARRCRRSMAIRAVPLSDPWALRQLTVCVRRLDALPAHARRLVEHLAKDAPPAP
ncbi:DNA-binding transcriptional LysR family regulator [Inquilinus ginsengisoli]|uniref:DNA-binding transcriptional LysR family regulator n=1 Tax=Inquilinus ginsengisoli TaxID=363840 RepID=A0ABU1JGX1_9PROT|nr:LysR substrate-binding domain-containing protein [Inquilinus ginsengisoli]MDR6287868.1 DNA-binding transcriptional LysR family regulator [Inquilinus ginsengisoli]